MCSTHTQRVNTAAFHPDATRRKPGLITVKAHGNALRKYSSASFFHKRNPRIAFDISCVRPPNIPGGPETSSRITGIAANTRHFEVLINTLRREASRIKPQIWTLNITFSHIKSSLLFVLNGLLTIRVI